MWLVRALTIVVVLNAGLCGARAQLNDHAQTTPVRTYEVLRADRLVLTVTNKPGPITSTATPPVNSNPVMHPFLSATAHSASEENALHMILVQSGDFNDFLRRLARSGYTVRERANN
jgi:hypothetical protein